MTDNHYHSFFGQNIGMMIQSSSKSDPHVFIRCIKKKTNGDWEKPSQGEGKLIKCSLEEIVSFLQVINRTITKWKSHHFYKDIETPISVSWDEMEPNNLWINIGDYSKMLNLAEVEVLKLLFKHLLKEKIEFGTCRQGNGAIYNSNLKDYNKSSPNSIKSSINKSYIVSEQRYGNDMEQIPKSQYKKRNPGKFKQDTKKTRSIEGVIKGETAKALLIDFNTGTETWIPKSTIHSPFTSQKDLRQTFMIDQWVLKKNQIPI